MRGERRPLGTRSRHGSGECESVMARMRRTTLSERSGVETSGGEVHSGLARPGQ